jgi:predicted transcriptional regulator YheO
VYEIYNAANLMVGFLCINSKTSFIIEGATHQSMWKQMETWADRCEQDDSLKQIARRT